MKPHVEEDGWRGFIRHCLNVQNEQDLEAYFGLFLTNDERQVIAGRYQIVRELLRGEKSQREIAKDLEVSIANISRGSNALKTTKSSLKKYLENK